MPKDTYIVKLIPKYKSSTYKPTVLRPYKNEVKWSKSEATKEARFAMKGRLWTGINAKDAYRWEIEKEKKSSRKQLSSRSKQSSRNRSSRSRSSSRR